MFTLVRGPTLVLSPIRYLFRLPILTPACRSIHCQRPRRSTDDPLLFPSAYCYNLMNQMIALATRSP
jgi:hypothetical protein